MADIEIPQAIEREVDPITKKGLYKLPLFCVPSHVTTKAQVEGHIDEFWRGLANSYKMEGHTLWDQENFCHPMQMVNKIEMIKGADYNTEDKIRGWNLVFIGKNDCTIMGCLIAAATDMPYWQGNIKMNQKVSQ